MILPLRGFRVSPNVSIRIDDNVTAFNRMDGHIRNQLDVNTSAADGKVSCIDPQ